MSYNDDDDIDEELERLPHIVLINHEEQYSLWRADMDIPGGWSQVWGPDTKEACMAWVDEVWTDMRPLSLRKAMEADEKKAAAAAKDVTPAGKKKKSQPQ
ncbi:MAG TPA: MbtH family NRPS accessory protein [Stellaceae bacterium]|jgi:MbtH protein|nr:MbtH family NRPS accessory protein [Stellaceae bacterium]